MWICELRDKILSPKEGEWGMREAARQFSKFMDFLQPLQFTCCDFCRGSRICCSTPIYPFPLPPEPHRQGRGGGEPCAGIRYFGLKRIPWCRVERVLTRVSSSFSAFPQIRKHHFKATFSWLLLPKIGCSSASLKVLNARAPLKDTRGRGGDMSAADSCDQR